MAYVLQIFGEYDEGAAYQCAQDILKDIGEVVSDSILEPFDATTCSKEKIIEVFRILGAHYHGPSLKIQVVGWLPHPPSKDSQVVFNERFLYPSMTECAPLTQNMALFNIDSKATDEEADELYKIITQIPVDKDWNERVIAILEETRIKTKGQGRKLYCSGLTNGIFHGFSL